MHAPFEDVLRSYARALNGLSADALERRPGGDPARWNARQIVEHLLLSYGRSSSVFRERLEKGRPTKSQLTAKQWLPQLMVIKFGYFPRGREAPEMVRPAPESTSPMDGAALVGLMARELAAMDETLLRCEREFGSQKFATHQILGPLSAEEWRRFHAVHAKHHLKQVARAIHP